MKGFDINNTQIGGTLSVNVPELIDPNLVL